MIIKAKERYYLIPVYELTESGYYIISYKLVPERRLR
jgi:hypothetical protein